MRRRVILVPADDDARAGAAPYYENFVQRVKWALEKGGLDCLVQVVSLPAAPAPPPVTPTEDQR